MPGAGTWRGFVADGCGGNGGGRKKRCGDSAVLFSDGCGGKEMIRKRKFSGKGGEYLAESNFHLKKVYTFTEKGNPINV